MEHLNKEIKTTETMPSVPVKRIRMLNKKLENLDGNEKITLQFILLFLFPSVWNNIKKYSDDCYTSGYLKGLEEGRNENKGSH